MHSNFQLEILRNKDSIVFYLPITSIIKWACWWWWWLISCSFFNRRARDIILFVFCFYCHTYKTNTQTLPSNFHFHPNTITSVEPEPYSTSAATANATTLIQNGMCILTLLLTLPHSFRMECVYSRCTLQRLAAWGRFCLPAVAVLLGS